MNEPMVCQWYVEYPVRRRGWTVRRDKRERTRWNRSRRRMNHIQRYFVRNLQGVFVGAKQLAHWYEGSSTRQAQRRRAPPQGLGLNEVRA